jgi:eukaryotic-like serine/threonine-protein kinase
MSAAEAIFTSNGTPLALGEVIGEGKQGVIRALPAEPALAAKLFVPEHRMPHRVSTHLRTDARDWFDVDGHPRVAWPIVRVYKAGAIPAGYLMVRFPRDWLPVDDLLTPDDRRRADRELTWRDLAVLARDLAELVDRVRTAHYVVGDLSAMNVLASPDGRTALVDCDDMVDARVAPDLEFRPLTTPRYGAPELRRSPPSYPDAATDAWALGVLIVQLLQNGAHPFEGPTSAHAPPHGVTPNIDAGRTRFAEGRLAGGEPVPTHPAWLPVETLPPDLLRLARRCLIDGRADRSARPAPRAWADALHRVMFAQCELRTSHVYGADLPSCPWCAHARGGQPDPFPARQWAYR